MPGITKNFLAINGKTLVYLLVSMAATALIVRIAGAETYSEVAALLGLAALTSILGNAFVDASVKRVMASRRCGSESDLSRYLSSSLFLLLCSSLAALAIGAVVYAVAWGSSRAGLLTYMVFGLASATLLISGVFRVGAFLTGEFVLQSLSQIAGKLTYICALALTLFYVSAEPWAVGAAQLVAAILTAGLLFIVFKRQLPTTVLSIRLVNIEDQTEVVKDVGAMQAVYGGVYLATSALLVQAKLVSLPQPEFINLALALSVGAIVGQLMNSFAYLSIPKIHKLAQEDSAAASRKYLRAVNAKLLQVTVLGSVFVWMYGGLIISAWIGVELSESGVMLLTLCVVSFAVAAIASQVSHYSLAVGKLRAYAAVTLFEGVLVLGVFWLLVSLDVPHPAHISISCAVLFNCLKICIFVGRPLDSTAAVRRSAGFLSALLGCSVIWFLNRYTPALLGMCIAAALVASYSLLQAKSMKAAS